MRKLDMEVDELKLKNLVLNKQPNQVEIDTFM